MRTGILQPGEVCTCPSRLLIQESIYEKFIGMVIERAAMIKRATRLIPKSWWVRKPPKSNTKNPKLHSDRGRDEGAEVITGGHAEQLGGDYCDGYYIQPTLLKGTNNMRVFQEEIFGPVVSVIIQGRSGSAGDCQRHRIRPGAGVDS